MENKQLLMRIIDTIKENSEAYVLATLNDGQVSLSMSGKDGDLTSMIEGISASYIESVLGEIDDDIEEDIADALEKLLDELGLGEDDAEKN